MHTRTRATHKFSGAKAEHLSSLEAFLCLSGLLLDVSLHFRDSYCTKIHFNVGYYVLDTMIRPSAFAINKGKWSLQPRFLPHQSCRTLKNTKRGIITNYKLPYRGDYSNQKSNYLSMKTTPSS